MQSQSGPRGDSPEYLNSNKQCRICLKNGKIPLFGTNDIVKDIMQITGIEISEFDNLPKCICKNCYALLQSALQFIKTAQASDLLLKLGKDLSTDEFHCKNENESVSSSEVLDNISKEPFVTREYLEVNEATEESDTEFDWSNVETHYTDNTSIDPAEDDKYLVQYLDIEQTDDEITEIEINNKTNTTEITQNKKCYTCNETFNSPDELTVHKKEKHNIITCEVCNEVVSKDFYQVHLKLHRSAYKQKAQKMCKKIECEICHKMVHKTYYKYHKKLTHGNEIEKAETMTQCGLCNKTISARNLTEHIKRRHDIPPKNDSRSSKLKKQCPVCDKNVLEDNYKEHLAKHGNPRKVYVCDTCGAKCATSSALNTHCLTHTNEFKYKCEFCPYKGSHIGLLKVHVRTHTKDYNYKCTLCPAKFITKSNLSIHMDRHTGVGKHKCNICQKTFFLKRNKENHIKAVHTTERNHKCEMCEATFAHRDGMLSHQIKVHQRGKLVNHTGRMPTYLKHELNKSGD